MTLFSAADSVHGRELWASDGTAQGTYLVKDIYPGPRSSRPDELVAFDGRVYFEAADSSYGVELWSSDGTAEGTALVADLWPGVNQNSRPADLTVAGGTLFFTASTGDEGREIWKVPAGGTAELVTDLRPGPDSSNPQDLMALGGLIAFSYYTPETGRELAISDGSAGGTEVFDIEPGATGSDPEPLFGQALKLLFSATTSDVGRELRSYTPIGDQICLIVDATPGPSGSYPREAVVNSTDVYFTADQLSGPGKHFLRSSVACTGLLENLHNVDSSGLTVYDGLVLFESEGDLWITDGTGPGTMASLIASPDIAAYSDGRQNVYFVHWGGLAWFMGAGGIWSSDGTAGGTRFGSWLHRLSQHDRLAQARGGRSLLTDPRPICRPGTVPGHLVELLAAERHPSRHRQLLTASVHDLGKSRLLLGQDRRRGAGTLGLGRWKQSGDGRRGSTARRYELQSFGDDGRRYQALLHSQRPHSRVRPSRARRSRHRQCLGRSRRDRQSVWRFR